MSKNMTTAELDVLLPRLSPEQQASINLQLGRKVTIAPPMVAVKPKANRAPKPLAADCWTPPYIELPFAIHTYPQAAGTGGHWAAKAKVAKSHRETIARVLHKAEHLLPALPIRVTLTRVGRRCDDDNIPSAMKHLRDGIADGYAHGDGDECFAWAYGQRPGDKKMRAGVVVRIETMETKPRRTGDK